MFDRDGHLLFDKQVVPTSAAGTNTAPVWSTDSRTLAAGVHGRTVLIDIGGAVSELQPPRELGPVQIQSFRWKDQHTLVVIASPPALQQSNPPAVYAVDSSTDPPAWSPTTINDVEPPGLLDTGATASAVQSAAVGETLTSPGPTVDGKGILFTNLRRGPAETAALWVYFDNHLTKIPLPSDVLSVQTARGGVVIAPAR